MNAEMFLAGWSPRLLSVLRIASGLLLLQHGTAKLLGIPTVPAFANMSLTSMPGIAGILEFFGGILIIVGLFTRPVAFILSGMTAVAYFYAHAGRGFYPIRWRAGGALRLRVPLSGSRRRRPLEHRRGVAEPERLKPR